MKLVQELPMPKFLQHVKLSNKQRPKFYKSLDELPPSRKLSNYYEKEGKVYKVADDTVVLKNPQSAYKPKFKKLSGNDFWSGHDVYHIRSLLAKKLKQFFAKEIRRGLVPFQPEDFPLVLRWDVYLPLERFDLSNLWFYHKMFEDTLVDEGIIPDDSVYYITGLIGPVFTPVPTVEDRKIIYKFFKDDRSIILENPSFLTHRPTTHVIPLEF